MKTRKELEREKYKVEITLIYIILFIMALLLVFIIISSIQRNKLETQLSSCQDKIPVCDFKDGYWGFEVRCDYTGWGQEVMDKHHYLTEEECNLWLEKWLDAKYCEVIE